jgi:hypothetical protein
MGAGEDLPSLVSPRKEKKNSSCLLLGHTLSDGESFIYLADNFILLANTFCLKVLSYVLKL